MRDVSERLRDIQEAIKQITKYTDSGRRSHLIRMNWCEFGSSIILRLLVKLLVLFRKNSKIVIQKFLGNKSDEMRNVLNFIHIYFGVDTDIIWEVVQQDLPVLKSSVDALLANQEGASNT